jgi:hypothetical protein
VAALVQELLPMEVKQTHISAGQANALDAGLPNWARQRKATCTAQLSA